MVPQCYAAHHLIQPFLDCRTSPDQQGGRGGGRGRRRRRQHGKLRSPGKDERQTPEVELERFRGKKERHRSSTIQIFSCSGLSHSRPQLLYFLTLLRLAWQGEASKSSRCKLPLSYDVTNFFRTKPILKINLLPKLLGSFYDYKSTTSINSACIYRTMHRSALESPHNDHLAIFIWSCCLL